MATKATRLHNYAHIATYNVASGQTATKGQYVQFASTDIEVQAAGGDTVDNLIGVAMEDAAALARVDVMHPGPIVPCKAGGTVTRGAKQRTLAAGTVQDAGTQVTGGSNVQSTYGFAVQSGVSADLIGVCQVFGNREVA